VDSRADQLDELRLADITAGTADVLLHRAVLGELVLERLPAGSHVVIMTHDHAEDFALCDAALRIPDTSQRWGSIGLIGSSAKWSHFRSQLLEIGHDEAAVDRITCPIGSAQLTGKEPAVIAVSIAAELLALLQLVGAHRVGA
jgi:xanthine dehydrogenase accessory factor